MRFLAFLFAASVLFGQLPEPKFPRPAPEQPIPFSHKLHAAKSVACVTCHTMPPPGDFARLPKTEVCMGCHSTIKKDSVAIQKVAAFHSQQKRIPWAPVYRIPDWVSFNHVKHNAVEGVTCATCHGPVAERDTLHREKDISMQACMDCHRVKNASNDCQTCHDPR